MDCSKQLRGVTPKHLVFKARPKFNVSKQHYSDFSMHHVAWYYVATGCPYTMWLGIMRLLGVYILCA